MTRSVFTYNVARGYPYWWFTPVVAVGAVLLTTLFSYLTLSSSGYALVTELTQNPNSTLSQGFYDQLPAFTSTKIRASCEAANLPVNSNFITNNSMLTYTLTSVESADKRLLPALTYQNNILQDCELVSTAITLDRGFARTASQLALRDYGAIVTGSISCKVQLDTAGLTTINMTAIWDPIPATSTVYQITSLPGRNSSSQSSLYWGESLLMLKWLNLTATISGWDNLSQNVSMVKAVAVLRHSGTTADITSASYFNITMSGAQFDLSQRWTDRMGMWFTKDTPVNEVTPKPDQPPLAVGGDQLAKAFESFILTDLGQISHKPNILAEPSLLEHFTSNASAVWADLGIVGYLFPTLCQGLAQTAYNSTNATASQLEVRASTIAVTYTCNIPRRKDTGALLLAVLLADLVLLQAVWKIFNLVVSAIVGRKDTQANWCEGCMKMQDPVSKSDVASESIALLPVRQVNETDSSDR